MAPIPDDILFETISEIGSACRWGSLTRPNAVWFVAAQPTAIQAFARLRPVRLLSG